MQIDLLKRAEKGSALNITEHDDNFTKIESALAYALDKTFTVLAKDTNPIVSVISHGISFVHSGSKVLEVVFDKSFSDYITHQLISQKYNGYKLVLTNKTTLKQTYATIKELAYTNETNTHIKAIVAETIEHADFTINDVVSCKLDFTQSRYAVKQLDTTIDEDVELGEVHIQHNATDIIKVVFDLHFSEYVDGYRNALLNGKGLHLHVINKTRAYLGTAKVTQIAPAGDALYAVSIEAGIDKNEFIIGHELEFRFDVNDAPGVGGSTEKQLTVFYGQLYANNNLWRGWTGNGNPFNETVNFSCGTGAVPTYVPGTPTGILIKGSTQITGVSLHIQGIQDFITPLNIDFYMEVTDVSNDTNLQVLINAETAVFNNVNNGALHEFTILPHADISSNSIIRWFVNNRSNSTNIRGVSLVISHQ